jgi:hypothetical protein
MNRNYSSVDHIQSLVYYCTDKRMDGFSQWSKKQELYEILWAVEEGLKKCPNFSIEQEWLDEKNKATQ